MGAGDFWLPWEGLPPDEEARPNPYWVERGMRSLYLLSASSWQTNLVTGQIGGTVAGAGPTFPDGWLRTPGVAGDGARLEHGLDQPIEVPLTIVVGFRRISGSVCWALMRNDISQWTGWYGENTGQIKSTRNNSFDGDVSVGGDGNVAFCHASAAALRAASISATAVDTSTTIPDFPSSKTQVTLGWSDYGSGASVTPANPAVAEFTHFAFIQGELEMGELALLASGPGALFAPRRIYVPTAAAPTLPTLSNLRIVAGSKTSTGWTARVTAS
jgi:hypothetical protein